MSNSIKMWVGRDHDGTLWIFNGDISLEDGEWWPTESCGSLELDRNLFTAIGRGEKAKISIVKAVIEGDIIEG